jgi:hypothetical protein
MTDIDPVTFRLVRFNPRRASRNAPAAEVEFADSEHTYRLWMTEKEIRENLVLFDRPHGLLVALEAYRLGLEIKETPR